MANKKFRLGMLVTLGILLVGCMDKGIDGTWVDSDNSEVQFIFNAGEFEHIHRNQIVRKGIYTIDGKNLTLTGQTPNGSITGEQTLRWSISGNKLTLKRLDQNGEEVEYGVETLIKKQEVNPGNTSVSKISAKNLVGIWELENAIYISRNELSDKDEFFSDGTGISSQRNQNISFTWRLRDGNRLQMDTTMGTQIGDIELSDNGKLLTYFLDEEHRRKAMYRKK